jgi:hypothetical protein
VRHLVSHIQRMGLNRPGPASDAPPSDGALENDDSPLRTASRPSENEGQGGDRASSNPVSPERTSNSSTALPAEAPERSTGKTPRESQGDAKPGSDNAN